MKQLITKEKGATRPTLVPNYLHELGRNEETSREAYVERQAVGEAEGAEETEALVLGARAAVADHDCAAHHRRASAGSEDLWCDPSPRLPLWLRFREPYRAHLSAGPPQASAPRKWAGGSWRGVEAAERRLVEAGGVE